MRPEEVASVKRSKSYSVYDSRGKRLVGNVDRETAVRTKERAQQAGMRDVSMIRRGQEGKEPGPREL